LDIINRVSRFATADDEVNVEDTHQSLGGSGANFAAALSNLGIRTGIMARVGRDYWGDFIFQELSQRGVQTGRLKSLKKATGMSYIAVDDRGERSIYTYMGANAGYELDDEDLNYIRSCRWLHLTGMYIEVVKEASQHAKNLSFNPGMILSSFGLDELESTLKNTDILFLNQKEVTTLTGLKTDDGIELLVEIGVPLVILTRGEYGARAYTKEECISAPSGQANALDTTGAGDTFAAGFIASYLRSKGLKDCLEAANNTAALHIGHWGGVY
jgi:sugar/nucleoside kinase (ribokinase family)